MVNILLVRELNGYSVVKNYLTTAFDWKIYVFLEEINMSEWKEYKLGDIADVRDGTHDSPKASSDGYPLVTSKNLKGGYIDLSNSYLISRSDYDFINQRSKVDKWDVLFSMIGTIGECAIVKQEPDYAIKNVGLFKTGGDKLLAQWIYYYFHSQQAKNEINARIKGSTQQYISLTDLRNFPIVLPSKERQYEIVSILSSLDDKIDLLHRENATLEAMAETLFRQWFIEEAKEDWEEVLIADLFEVKDGTQDSPRPQDFGYKLITSKYIRNNLIDFDGAYNISEQDYIAINKRSKVEIGDVLFSMIGTIGLIYLELNDEINYAIKNVGLIKTSQNKLWKYFVYLWFKSELGQDWIFENKTGSTQEYISLASLRSIKFRIESIQQVEEFNQKVKNFFSKININQEQICVLTQMRDSLLNKLMLNEINL